MEDPCAHCNKHAVCAEDGCQCREGYTGNGFFCERGISLLLCWRKILFERYVKHKCLFATVILYEI